MEQGKKSGSSLASDLFGAKDSSAAVSSSGVFGSIFAPPPKVSGWESSLHSSETEKKNSHGNPAWSAKNGVSDYNSVGGEGSRNTACKDNNSSYYQEEKAQPFHYSSSIYYGGQDVYSRPQNAHNPETTTYNKDAVEDDSGSASRGNWWQGSLYY